MKLEEIEPPADHAPGEQGQIALRIFHQQERERTVARVEGANSRKLVPYLGDGSFALLLMENPERDLPLLARRVVSEIGRAHV